MGAGEEGGVVISFCQELLSCSSLRCEDGEGHRVTDTMSGYTGSPSAQAWPVWRRASHLLRMTSFKAVVCSAAAAVAAFVAHLAFDAGEFSPQVPHGLYGCAVRFRDELLGPEDVAVDHEAGVAYVSADDRVEPFLRGGFEPSDPAGAVWRYTFGGGGALERVELRGGDAGVRPHPHGVDYRDGLLAFVDHSAAGGERVEVYRLAADGSPAADRVASVRHPALMTDINDVALEPGGRSFFVTNWHHYPAASLMGLVEKYGRRPWTNVLHCTTEGDCREAAGGFVVANGVTLSPDGTRLWVVECVGRSVHEFAVGGGGALTLLRRLPTPGAMGDNLSYNPADGSLLLVAHTRALTLVNYLARPRHAGGGSSPWSVLRLDAGSGEFREVARSLGELVSAGSVAATHGNTTLIGHVTDRGLLVCDGALA